MFDENILLFLLITFVGFFITFIGSRNKSDYRRYIITGGTGVAHVGIFGILYDKLSFTPFISLVLFVVSVFVLIDPLKMSKHFPDKACRTVGLLLLFAATAFFLMYVTGFPVWLWVFPLMIYVMPYTIPSWRARLFYFRLGAWALVLLFAAIISYNIYSTYFPQAGITELDTVFAGLSNKDNIKDKLQLPFQAKTNSIDAEHKPSNDFELIHNPISQNSKDASKATNPAEQMSTTTTPSSDLQDVSVLQTGPILDSLKEFDAKYLEMKRDFQKLQDKYRETLHELEVVKIENEELKKRLAP